MFNLIAKVLFVGICLVCAGDAQGLFGNALLNNPATAILEAQIQLAIREQQTLAYQLVNNGNRQIALTGTQIQIAKNIQNANIQRIANQGLFQVFAALFGHTKIEIDKLFTCFFHSSTILEI